MMCKLSNKCAIRGHFEPKAGGAMPEISVFDMTINSSNWFEASFTCFGCIEIDLNDNGRSLQSFIWATNSGGVIESASEDAKLELHDSSGHFSFDVAKALSHGSRPTTGPAIDFSVPNEDARIENEGNSHGHSHSHSHSHEHSHSHSLAVPLHGIFMTVAVAASYPVGAMAIRSGSKRAFKLHVGVQAIASMLSFFGVILGGIAIASDVWVGRYLLVRTQPSFVHDV